MVTVLKLGGELLEAGPGAGDAKALNRCVLPSSQQRMNSSTLVQKLWNYCNVLRDDGMSYGDDPSAGSWTALSS